MGQTVRKQCRSSRLSRNVWLHVPLRNFHSNYPGPSANAVSTSVYRSMSWQPNELMALSQFPKVMIKLLLYVFHVRRLLESRAVFHCSYGDVQLLTTSVLSLVLNANSQICLHTLPTGHVWVRVLNVACWDNTLQNFEFQLIIRNLLLYFFR